MSHRPNVIQLTGPAYVAVCNCGFIGKDKKTMIDARVDANEHLAKELRYAQQKEKPAGQ